MKINSNRIATIPNLISFIRIILLVVAGYELIIFNNYIAFIIYIVAICSDFFDGFLARKFNQISELGKILDPLADKLMVISASIILVLQKRMPIWFAITVLMRDVIIMVGGLILASKIKFVIPSIMVGKITAVILMITFCLNIIDFKYINILYYISLIMSLISIIAYAINAKKILVQSQN